VKSIIGEISLEKLAEKCPRKNGAKLEEESDGDSGGSGNDNILN
jgi:hypothetical protein